MHYAENTVMDLRLLEAFRLVVSNRSVTRAAEVLGVTQPAVSAQMARLEASAGFPLFVRTKGRLALTQEGASFHREVMHALDQVERLDRIAESIRLGQAGRLVVASHPSASISLLPPLVARLTVALPDVSVKMINRTSEEVRALFPAATIDIGIAELPIDIAGVDVRRYHLDCVAIVPKGHALARLEAIGPADLSGEPFLSMPSERLIHHRIRAAFSDAGAYLNSVAEVDFFSSICAVVASGGGVSIVDRWSAEMFAPLGFEVRPFYPAIPYEIGVLVSSDREPTKLARDFLNLIHETLSR